MKTLSIGELSSEAGNKTTGFVKVCDTQTTMPVTLVNGAKDGKTVLITAGIHGSEYPCIQTAIELAQELDPKEISGQIIVIHPVNTQAFAAKVPFVVPEDNKNINCLFPGNENGTISEKIAYTITSIQDKVDFYMDLHGGDIQELVIPYVYYPGVADEEVVMTSRKAACVLDLPYMFKSKATTGAYNSAAIRGLPCILIERGGCGLWTQEEVDAYKKDVKNVLRHLGVLPGQVVYPKKEPKEITNAIYQEAKNGGCWYPFVKVGEKVCRGQILGEVRDFFGKTIDTYYAEFDSVILYMAVSLAVNKGNYIITYGEV